MSDGPDHAGHLVGECDGGLVVTAGPFSLEGPGAKRIEMRHSLAVQQCGSGAVDDEWRM